MLWKVDPDACHSGGDGEAQKPPVVVVWIAVKSNLERYEERFGSIREAAEPSLKDPIN